MASTLPLLSQVISALAVLGAVAPVAGKSQDGPLEIEFNYSAPADCPGETAAFSLVERRSRRVVRVPAGAGRERLSMTIHPEGTRRVGVLTVMRTSGEEEQRSVVGESCSEVVEALALTAALSIDPDATVTLGPALDDRGAMGESGEPVADADAAIQSEASAPADEREPVRISLGPSFSIQQLLDTTTHLGGGLALEVSRPSRRSAAPFEFWANANVLVDPNEPGSPGIVSWFLLARLAYCPMRVGEKVAFLACPSTQLGFVSAESQGVEDPSQALRFFATLGLTGRLRADVSEHLRLWIAPSVDFPVTKRDFGVAPDPEPLVSTVDVGWDVAAGISWTF